MFNIQRYLLGTTTLDVEKKLSFQTGGLFRQVQSAWKPIVEMVFPDRAVFPEGIVPGRFRSIMLASMILPILAFFLACYLFLYWPALQFRLVQK